ncbi:MAG: NADP-dependent malic enzyme [Candidatus Competibacteraceae bacterium]|nr:NADP-dependent malic enzyme [Candidatus Competibacteraceae bacterium]
MINREDALEYHQRPPAGKIEVTPSKPCLTQRDLSLAYSPGVAEPCREIAADPQAVYRYTAKGNLVAVISNGSAVLGLGDIGPLAGKPVMEGKGVLFKRFADIDVFDIELAAPSAEEIIMACRMLEPTFGGISLEDIAAPICFEVEERLKAQLSIPVFHDDQHGTAIISGAALLNACRLTDRPLETIRVVVNGAGAAGIACANFYLSLGVQADNLLLCDSQGVIYRGREDLDPHHPRHNPYKARFARDTPARSLTQALEGADVFCGVSKGGVVSTEMVRSMADNPIIFAMANPDPEIGYDEARAARQDAIVATGRSDHPNQVNNVLGFPFIFRGALDVRASAVNEAMKVAAARALAELAREPVPEAVCHAYGVDRLEFGRDYLIPKPFDSRVLLWATVAVARAACDSGVARVPIDDFEAYEESLERRLGRTREIMRQVIHKARRAPARIAFPEGDDERIIRAAARVRGERIGTPLLLGSEEVIRARSRALGVDLSGVEYLDPARYPQREALAQKLFERRARRGMTLVEARRLVARRHYFAPMLLVEGEVDAVVCGQTRNYPEVIRPALQIIPRSPGIHHAAGLYVLLFKRRIVFCADTTVNIEPTADALTEIALCAANIARDFDIEPRVAILCFSNFGSVNHPLVERVRRAVEQARSRDPQLLIEGDMQADTAFNQRLLQEVYPFSRLQQEANVLIFPDLASGNIAYKLLRDLGGAEAIGPILMGLSRPYHVMQRGAAVDEIVNIAALAAVQAQGRAGQ